MTIRAYTAKETSWHPGCDLVFIVFAALFAWLACQGVLSISADGAVLDSDLQTYAQAMTAEKRPELFATDPALDSRTEANSIPNLERFIAGKLSFDGNFAAGLLRAGGLAIFVFYCGWYIFGRFLLNYPSLAATLALCCGVTFWVGWGTFWGITHSDPVPRVFFAALMPFLLVFMLVALRRPWLRPLCMFVVGCCMWVHGVSALNCGAMFFLAFLFIKPTTQTLPNHINNSALSLIAFAAPVALFLWPSLSQGGDFSKEELDFFNNFMKIRWERDFSNFWPRFADFFNPANPRFTLFACAVAGFFILLFKGGAREKLFARAAPCFLLAIVCAAIFSWAETILAPKLGRVPMGHELARGLRFLIPVSWVLAVAGLGVFLSKTGRRIVLILCFGLIAFFSNDRQYMAAQYEIGRLLHISTPLSVQAEKEKAEAEAYRSLISEVEKIVPEGEAIFSNAEDMTVRYLARRPLAHTFKDGYLHFYNKDYEKSRRWMDFENEIRSGSNGEVKAWLKSDAPWFLGKNIKDKYYFSQFGDIALDKNGYILVRRKN